MQLTVWQPIKNSFEVVVVGATPIGLTATKYYPGDSLTTISHRNAEVALITVETNSIRWTADGTTPTAATGHLAEAGDSLSVEGHDSIRLFRAVQASAGATIQVSYYGG